MKKLLVFSMLCMMVLCASAQSVAVFEIESFKGSTVDYSEECYSVFTSTIKSKGFTVTDSAKLNEAIEQQGFKRHGITQQQALQVGEALGVSKIVYAYFLKKGDFCNLVARVIDVQSGTVVANERTDLPQSSATSLIERTAQKLASKLDTVVQQNTTVEPKPQAPAAIQKDLPENAPRIAVMRVAVYPEVPKEYTDICKDVFYNEFRPSGYRYMDQAQVRDAFAEHGLKRSQMNKDELIEASKTIGLTKILYIELSAEDRRQFKINAQLIDVQSRVVELTESAYFELSHANQLCRTVTQGVVQKLTTKLEKLKPRNRESVVTVAKLNVFPNELGMYTSEPKELIARINQEVQHGYNNWRLPSNVEMDILRGYHIVTGDNYMTKENKYGIVLLVTDGPNYATIQKREQENLARQAEARAKDSAARAQKAISAGWLDLGLPSGTLWSREDGIVYEVIDMQFGRVRVDNYENKKYRMYYSELINTNLTRPHRPALPGWQKPDNSTDDPHVAVPTGEQFLELFRYCKLRWNNLSHGVDFIGPSGKVITLRTDCWTSDELNKDNKPRALIIYREGSNQFTPDLQYEYDNDALHSVRLVYNP